MNQFNLNIAAFREIRNSEAVQAELLRRAEMIRDASGPGYEAGVQEGKNRARAGVVTATAHAMNSNAKHNTLVRNLEAGRD